MAGTFWQDKRVIVTGGAGFLGSFVIEKLEQRGATDIFIPRIQNYNLVDPNDIRRLYAATLKDGDPKNVVMAGASRRIRAEIFSITELPANGTRPVSILNSVQPRLKMSERMSALRLSSACSGARPTSSSRRRWSRG